MLKKILIALLLSFVLISAWGTASADTLVEYDHKTDPALDIALDQSNPLTPHEVIIQLDDMAAAGDIAALATSFIQMQQLPMVGAVLTGEQIEQILPMPAVKYITYNSELEYFLAESVPLIGADQVWSDYDERGGNVAVAVIDSGIDGTHPDLLFGSKTIQNVKMTPFGVGIENVPNTDTSSGHGTHVASTIGGLGTMSGGYYKGVAPDVNLVGLGAGEAIAILTAVQSYDWALANADTYNIRVISNSWGTSGGDFDPNNAVNVASYNAYEQGILSVFAAGNDGGYDILNPYSLAPWVLSVAAGDKQGDLAGFSSRGLAGDFFKHPDLTAPGVDIYAARCSCIGITALDPINPDNPEWTVHYTAMSGTSMATPHVSGAAALLFSSNDQLSPDEVMQLLTETTTPMADYELHEVGTGYLNALNAIEASQTVAGNMAAFLAGERQYDLAYGMGFDTETMRYHTAEYRGYTAVGLTTMPANEFPIEVNDKLAYVDVRLTWDPAGEDAYDMELLDETGTVVATSGNSVGESETIIYAPESTGMYTLRVAPFAAGGTSFTASVTRAYGEALENWPPTTPPAYDFYLNVTNIYKNTGVIGLAAEYLRGGDSGFIVFTFTPADGSPGLGFADSLQAIYRDQTGEIVYVDDNISARETAGEYQSAFALDNNWGGMPGPVSVSFAYTGEETVDAQSTDFFFNHMDVTLNTDMTNYYPGEVVQVDGTVVQWTTIGVENIQSAPVSADIVLRLIDSDGNTLATDLVTSDLEGNYSGSLPSPTFTRGPVQVVAEATYQDVTIVNGPASWYGITDATVIFPGNLAPEGTLYAAATVARNRDVVHIHATATDPDGLNDIDSAEITITDGDGRQIRRYRIQQFSPIGDELMLTRTSPLNGIGPWTVTLTVTDSADNTVSISQTVTLAE
jgi:serine protease AprX